MPLALESVESCPLKAKASLMIAKGGKQVQEQKLTSKPIIYAHMQKFFLADVKRDAKDDDEAKALMKFAECTEKQAVGEPLWSRFLDPIKHDMNDPFLVGHAKIFPTGIPSGTQMITEDHRTQLRDFVWQRAKEAALQRPFTTKKNKLEKARGKASITEEEKASITEEIAQLVLKLKKKITEIPPRPDGFTPLLEPIWNAFGAWSSDGMIEAWSLDKAPGDLQKMRKQGTPITKKDITAPTGRLAQRAGENAAKGDGGFSTASEILKAEMLYAQQGMLRQGKKNFSLYKHTAELAQRTNRIAELKELDKEYKEMQEAAETPEETLLWTSKRKAARNERLTMMESQPPEMADSPSPVPLPSPLRKRSKYSHITDTDTNPVTAAETQTTAASGTPFTPANASTYGHSSVTIPTLFTDADAHQIDESLVENFD